MACKTLANRDLVKINFTNMNKYINILQFVGIPCANILQYIH